MNRVPRLILLVTGAIVLAAACGSSGDDGAATTDAGVTVPPVVEDDGDEPTDEGDGDDGFTRPSVIVIETVEGVEGVEVYEDLSRNHVENPTYAVRPPPGGDHLNQWESCGFFATEIADGNAVHSLEHGAVWVAYRPDLDEASLDELESLANVETHLLVSPYPGLETPLMLVAWGLRLPLESIDDERFDRFLATFIRGPQTPEPGVACRF